MIKTEYKGELFYLWVNMPNWANGLSIELGLPSRIEAGLSDRESRRKLGNSLRVFQYQFVSLIEGHALQELRSALKSRTTERVMVPFWPAMRHPDEFALLGIEAGVNLTFDLHPYGRMKTSSFQLHEGTLAQGWPVSEQTCTVPLLLGHLDDVEPSILGKPDLAEVPVRFVEDSTVAESLSITPQAWQNGPDVNGTVFSVFPLTPNTASPPKAGGTRLVIERDILGQGRRTREDYHKATPYESISMDYQCATAEEWLKLLAFFTERTDWKAFWLPVPLQTTRLARQSDGSNQIVVSDSAWIQPGDGIALWDSTGHVVRRVHSKSDTTLTLDNPVGLHAWQETMVSPAILARLVKRRLKLAWLSDALAEASLEFRELPPESMEPGPESAKSLGALPTLASLYTFTQRPSYADQREGSIGDVPVSRFTSYERDLSSAALSWQAISITHGAVKRGLDLQDECAIEAELLECPVLLAHWRKETGTVDVTIERAEVVGTSVTNRRVVFAGEVRKLTSRGTRALVTCGIPRVFDAMLPRARFAPVCQWALFSVPCGLPSGDWTFEARVADVGTPGYPFTFVLNSITRQNGKPLPGGFGSANWFAWGALTSQGDTVGIRQSSTLSGGAITLTLARDPNPMLSVGETVRLRPGCDGLPETCQGKFDNFLNWGGARVAAANLSLVKVNLPGGDSGGKK